MACLLMVVVGMAEDPATKKPHLMYILADDFGWADSDWHRPTGWPEAATPNMLKLVHDGIELDNMYTFKFCGAPMAYHVTPHPDLTGRDARS